MIKVLINKGWICLGMASILLPAMPARSIPLFARKYNVTCFTCHVSPPFLNDFGRRFQANGYNLPGSGSDQTAQADQPALPLALLSQPMIAHRKVTDRLVPSRSLSSTEFSGLELAIFSSASLGPHFSYFAETSVLYEKGETSIDLVSAHLLYTDVLDNGLGNLNFRLGKMRAFIPFAANAMFSNATPLIYSYNPFNFKYDSVFSVMNVAEPSLEISAFGLLPQLLDGLRWEIGVSGGTKNNINLDVSHAYVFSLNQTVYIDNAPIRFGISYYGGIQNAMHKSDSVRWQNVLRRAGIDVELYDPWTKRFNLFGQYVVANDNHVLEQGGIRNMKGGFAGLNIIVLPEKLYAFGRYDYMKTDETEEIRRQLDIGIRYHLLPNLIITGAFTSLSEALPQLTDRSTISYGAGILFGL